MLHKEFNNELRAYPTHQAVQTIGSTAVFSSATGRQYALENMEWGNGAFTKGVVEGIRGKADFKSTGRITVNMLDLYVSERVKELTKGQQTPTTVKPPNVPDFPVALLR